jgi:hypothetical protein
MVIAFSRPPPPWPYEVYQDRAERPTILREVKKRSSFRDLCFNSRWDPTKCGLAL